MRKSTPAGIIERLNREINAILADPQIMARLDSLGAAAFASSSAELERFIEEDTARWAKAVRFSGAKPD